MRTFSLASVASRPALSVRGVAGSLAVVGILLGLLRWSLFPR
jgi:hypothetical protein